MRTFKKGLILAVCLLLVGLMSACTFTVDISPEDITAFGSALKDCLEIVSPAAAPETDGPFACPGSGNCPALSNGCGMCGSCGCCREDMGYREAPVGDAAPAEDTPENSNFGLPNPVKECFSLAEINEIAGTKLMHPGVMGVSDETFCTITGVDAVLADYDFTVAGYRWCFRAGAVANYDISGVYIGGVPAFSGEPNDRIEYAEGEGYKLARWFTIDGQYVLSVADGGEMEQETFVSIAEEMCEMTQPGMSSGELEQYYTALEGSWQDETSGRAVMTVKAEGSECVRITVEWGNSASETERWTMTARLAEDGLLNYYDCTRETVTAAENGEETVTAYTGGEGFFGLSAEDGKLYWTGAAEPEAAKAVFVHVPENTLAGDWFDLFSERAMMTVEKIPGSEAVSVRVDWSSSAFENTCWTMTATYDAATRRLSYSDCVKSETVTHEDAPEDTTVLYTNGTGYFVLSEEGHLCWSGAIEGDCCACEFVIALG